MAFNLLGATETESILQILLGTQDVRHELKLLVCAPACV